MSVYRIEQSTKQSFSGERRRQGPDCLPGKARVPQDTIGDEGSWITQPFPPDGFRGKTPISLCQKPLMLWSVCGA